MSDKKYLKEEEIERELNHYLYDVKIKYAILLNGTWGSGKTYFIKNYIKKLDKKYFENKNDKESIYKKTIYVSLYGLNDVSELKHKIALSLIKNENIKKVMPLLDLGVEIGSDVLSKTTPIQSSDKKITKVINTFHKVDNLIIFFDDLERCNININTVLGYINELVEHNNNKVIIIADEDKIGKVNYQNNLELKYLVALSNNYIIEEQKDKNNYDYLKNDKDKTKENVININKEEILKRSKYLFGEDDIYNEIKEKLIGKVIYYRADIDKVYNYFLNEIIHNKDAKEMALKNKEFVLKQMNELEHYNLRTIQFMFESFNRLVSESINIINLEEVKETYLKNLFSYCCYKSLKIKQGDKTYNWDNNQKFGTVYLKNRMIDFILSNWITGFKFVDDYLFNSCINYDDIKSTLENYKKNVLNELHHPDDPVYRLQSYWIIPERKLNTIISELIEKIQKNYYELNAYSKIVEILSRVEEMNVCKTKIHNAIKELEYNIKNDLVKGEFIEDRIFDGNKNTTDIYSKNIKKIKNLVKEKQFRDDIKDIEDIYNDINWGTKLKDYCEKNNSKFLYERKFSYVLDIEKIVDNIKNKEIEQIYEFWYALQKIYNFSNVKEYFENDIDKLEELINKLKEIKKIDKVKLFAISKISTYISHVITNLKLND